MTYLERVDEYHQRYAYMKSWAGLLRILGCVELLLGAAVFACVCAYVHKDNEWFNMYGYSQPQLFGGLGGGSGGGSYSGPKTPFVLVVAGLAWIVTVILVVLGMSLYYRAILLDSLWWPITECSINLVLALLYLSAGIVAGVCLKLWRHEAARMRKEALVQEMRTIGSSVPLSILGPASRLSEQTPLPTVQPDLMDSSSYSAAAPLAALQPEILRGHIPAGHIPKPVVIADYVAKYPSIRSEEERDQYRAVFNDQHAEYRELHAEVQAMAKRFEGMDEMMHNLPTQPSSQMDPTYLEKRDRCEYLKNKLSHIKQKIQEYNKVDPNNGN
ncbi:MARVEL domain-containing protein 2 [Liparis tanakae]|uniref:MARVEL domain-containing protein 2 n=1 Tax=Liparis tanakae TaxID=230148 RepID=A0A4Z2FAM5_9TELE|nr:MARVEL domain-containing protein 2 [Liparis tanakae]